MWEPGMWTPAAKTSDRWVPATASLPVAFAQVREDPRIDRLLIEKVGTPIRGLMIASGGETAAVLASQPIESLHLVDFNPAQIALTRLKLSMLLDTSTEERLQLLGHRPMNVADRQQEIQRRLADMQLAEDVLGPPGLVAQWGPDFCARYEWVFARLRQTLFPCRAAIAELLSLSDPDQQAKLVAPGSELGQALERAFDEAMDLSNLVDIFGPEATANRAMPFSRHFMRQTRMALSRFEASANPFLHQILSGEFFGPLWDWFALPKQSALCSLQFSVGELGEVIAELPDASLNFIHLSNILDWVSPREAEKLLNHVHRCLSLGGLVVIRQLNSTLDIAAVPSGLAWQRDIAEQLHHMDRSFFYRALYVGSRE